MTVLVIVFFMFAFLILVSLGTYALENNDKVDNDKSLIQPPLIGQKWSANFTLALNCAKDEIALQSVQGIEPGCYSKAGLYETCQVKEQCTVKYSYCAFHFDVDEDPPEESIEDSSENSSKEELHDNKICTCNDGYTPNPELTSCLRTHPKCSLMTSNPNYTQEDCPYTQQFCQYGTCLCAPGYAYNLEGQCVWFVPDNAEPNDRKPVESIAKPEIGYMWNMFGHKVQLTIGIISLWIVAVGLLSVLILGFLFCLKLKRNNPVDLNLAEQQQPLADSESK